MGNGNQPIHNLRQNIAEGFLYSFQSLSICYDRTMKEIELLNELIGCIRLRELPDSLKDKYEQLQACGLSLDREDPLFQRYFRLIRRYSFTQMQRSLKQRFIVSLTSFPPRMKTIHKAIDSLLDQTVKTDEVILWLAEEQYPQRYEDLPDTLKDYEKNGKLTIRWCDDLRPHKKYYYAMKENPDALIVTADDDIIYDQHALEYLLVSYLEYPECVSALRAHIISMKDGQFLPYSDWLKNPDILVNKPAMELLVTGGSGTLYPPHLLPEALFDKEAIMQTCLNADDLWLKAMELVNDVPVVLAHHDPEIKNVEVSQKESLGSTNVHQNRNDEQLASIKTWIDEHYGEDFMEKKLTDPESPYVYGLTKISGYFQEIVERNTARMNKIYNLAQKVHKLREENDELKEELKQIEESKSYKIANKIRKVIKG